MERHGWLDTLSWDPAPPYNSTTHIWTTSSSSSKLTVSFMISNQALFFETIPDESEPNSCNIITWSAPNSKKTSKWASIDELRFGDQTLLVISNVPSAWRQAVEKWAGFNRVHDEEKKWKNKKTKNHVELSSLLRQSKTGKQFNLELRVWPDYRVDHPKFVRQDVTFSGLQSPGLKLLEP